MIKINRLQKFFFNAFLLSCASLVIRTISVSFNVFISGKIGQEGMGLLTLTMGIYGFALTFATSGINMAVVRLVSAAFPENSVSFDKKVHTSIGKIMKNAILYCLFFSVIASFALYFGAKPIGTYILGDARTISSLKLLSFCLVPVSISSALNGYFCAIRRVYKNVIVSFLEQGVKISVITFLLLTIAPSGLEYACISVVAGSVISELISVVVSFVLFLLDRRKFYKDLSKSGDRVSKIRGFYVNSVNFNDIETKVAPIALPVAISAYVRSALSTIEHLLIPWGLKKSGINASSAISSYGVLHGMVIPLLLFPSVVLGAFSSLLVPELSSALAKKDENGIKRIVSRVFDLTLIFAFGVSGIFICFSEEIGIFLYNSHEAGEYIRLLSPLIPLMYLDGAVDSMLKGLGKQVYTMRVNIVDSIISVILILILLPSFGISGYVAVIFITELINTSFSILKLLSVSGVKTPLSKWIIKPILSIIISTIVSRLIFNFFIAHFLTGKALVFCEAFFTLAIYILVSRLFGAITSSDISFFKSIFKRNKSTN